MGSEINFDDKSWFHWCGGFLFVLSGSAAAAAPRPVCQSSSSSDTDELEQKWMVIVTGELNRIQSRL